MTQSDDVSTVEKTFATSPRRLLAAVLAAKPHHFKLVAAQAATMHFTFSSAAGAGYHLGEFLTGRIGPDPRGSRLEIVGGTAQSGIRTTAAMHEFLDRVDFVLANPGYSEFLGRVSMGMLDDGTA